jgi:hypothetical protein
MAQISPTNSQAAVNQLVLISFAAIYLFAFGSLYVQIPVGCSHDGHEQDLDG